MIGFTIKNINQNVNSYSKVYFSGLLFIHNYDLFMYK